MHQTRKGNQWYCDMKVHVGADARRGYVHTITGTAANTHDIEETTKLIHEDDKVIYDDSRYSGVSRREEIRQDERLRNVKFRTNVRPSSIRITSGYASINRNRQIKTASHPSGAKWGIHF